VDTSDPGLRPRAPRKNLFLAASIRSGALSTPVRIRNLSETGALIEASALPDVGGQLRLKRSEIEIGGTIVWRSGNRCGLQFDGRISIDDWIAGRCQNGSLDAGQTRVDDIQRRLRAGELISQADITKAPNRRMPDLNLRIAEELGFVGRLLESVGDGFADDPILLQRHATALQNFDAACQILHHLQEVLAADDKAAAIGRVTMADLQSRLKRKALF
jgi:hypothetical protein